MKANTCVAVTAGFAGGCATSVVFCSDKTFPSSPIALRLPTLMPNCVNVFYPLMALWVAAVLAIVLIVSKA
jgi:hypothetical protein